MASVEVVRRLMDEVWGLGRFELLPGMIAPEYVAHLAIGEHYGPEGVRIEVQEYRGAMPDLAVELDAFVVGADGDAETVVRRFTLRGTRWGTPGGEGEAGRGDPVRLVGIGVDRVVGGTLVESWVVIAESGLV